MRVTSSSMFEAGVRSIGRAAEALVTAQRQLSSGRRLTAASDDPLAAASAVGAHALLERTDAYTAATTAARSRLVIADTILSDVIAQLSAAQSVALSARGSNVTVAQRTAIANELLGIRDAVMSDINTQVEGMYLFSGSRVDVPPIAAVGAGFSSYQGDAAPARIDITAGRTVAVGFDGGSILQGTDAQHVLDALTDLAAAIVSADDAGIAAGVSAVQRAFDRATTVQGSIGSDLRSTDDVAHQLTSARTEVLIRISRLEDADLAEASVRMTRAETAYRAALAAVAANGRLSLMDYLE